MSSILVGVWFFFYVSCDNKIYIEFNLGFWKGCF